MPKTIILEDLSLESYERFLACKRDPRHEVRGNQIHLSDYTIAGSSGQGQVVLSEFLFDYQKWIVSLAFEKERFAIFADCGLGKTPMFLEFARLAAKVLPVEQKILIISPLMVVEQTLAQERQFYGKNLFINLHQIGLNEWLHGQDRFGIINYDKFRTEIDFEGKVGCVIVDESSILKNEAGVIRTNIIKASKGVRFKLACTGTPAPNDREEYANHALFLEHIRSHQEFFARFFINRDNGWELKPHAKDAFYRSLAAFSVYLRDPKKYGFHNLIGDLEKPIFEYLDIAMTEDQHRFISEKLWGQSAIVRRGKLSQISKGFMLENGKPLRVTSLKPKLIQKLILEQSDVALVWVLYNEEGELIKENLERAGLRVCHIRGEMDDESRLAAIRGFERGEIQVIITKPQLLGFGLNLQFCQRQIFSGLSDSFERFYQAIKRSHRYGAKDQLHVYVLVTNHERQFLRNVLKKSQTFEEDANYQEQLYIKNILPESRLGACEATHEYEKPIRARDYQLINGDCIRELRNIPRESVDLAVFSPPFASLFTYTSDLADLGNSSDNDDEFALHFRFFLKGLFEVLRQGRLVCIHVSQLATFKSREGFIGLKDFRGLTIRLFQDAGFIFFGEWAIAKNPQMQAIKEKVRTLSFAQLESDRLGSRAGLSDFILVFKKPGEAETRLDDGEVSRDEWIEWACGVWTGIRESHTLNVQGTKSEEDVKHVCPLNLTVIERCIRMYSKEGELVLSPYMGIGSEGVVSIALRRRFLGIELKPEYFQQAAKNIANAAAGILPHKVKAKPSRMALETYLNQK